MFSPPHFQDPDSPPPMPPTLDASTYSLALDHLVIACVDLAFTHAGQLLLGKRNRYPRPSWWLIGGRMLAGESPSQAAIRKTIEETQLPRLTPTRLQYIGVYSTRFAMRHQLPQDQGLHSLNLVYQIELTSIETEQIHLKSEEYETYQWIELNQSEPILDRLNVMDQALLQVIQDIRVVVF